MGAFAASGNARCSRERAARGERRAASESGAAVHTAGLALAHWARCAPFFGRVAAKKLVTGAWLRDCVRMAVRRFRPSLWWSAAGLSLGLAVALASCASGGGGQRAAADPQASPPDASDLLSTAESIDLCVELHTQVRSCALEFTRLNLSLREAYSPEFAQKLREPGVREQVEAMGVAETDADAAQARERCTEFAKPQWGPPQPRADLARLQVCYAMPGCDDKMTCLRPIIEPRFAYRAQHPQQP
jgi:hypothetical protein